MFACTTPPRGSTALAVVPRRWKLPLVLAAGLSLLASAALAQEWIYTVRPGDNLWDITERHLKHIRFWKPLQRLNEVDDPWHMLPGTRLRIPLNWVRLVPASATAIAVGGEVMVQRAEDGQEVALAEGMALHGGDRMVTGPEGSATIEFGDGSRMLVEPDSQVVFDMLRAYGESGFVDTRVRVKQGRTEHQVLPRRGRDAPRYEIITPAATSAVRGTSYRMGAADSGERSATEVLDGTVDVAASGEQRVVPAGFGVVTRKGAPPETPSRLLDAPRLDGLPAFFDRVPLQMALPPLAGATGYRVQIADDEQFRTLRHDALLETPRIKAVDLPDGNYVLRVRGVDAGGLEGLDGYHRLTVDARPEAPVLMAPPEAARVFGEPIELLWAEPDGAVGYALQIATEADFTRPLVEVLELRENRYSLDQPLEPGVYYWRVATRDRAGEQGPFGDPQGFKRLAAAPDVAPPDVDEKNVTFRWSAGLPGDSYDFQLARDKGFRDILIDDRVTDPSYRIGRPESGTYYLRVRTVDAAGDAGPYGTPQRIAIPPQSYWPMLLMGLAILLAL